MLFRLRFAEFGSHTTVRVFAGQSEASLGNCGSLTMRNEEWLAFKDCFSDYTPLTNVEFIDEAEAAKS